MRVDSKKSEIAQRLFLLPPFLFLARAFLQQYYDVCDRGVIQIESLGSLRLQAHTIAVQPEEFADAGANRGGVRTDLRRSQNQTGVDIGYAVTAIVHAFQSLTQEDHGIRALPLGIGRWEERADIRSGDRAEQRVGNGVE